MVKPLISLSRSGMRFARSFGVFVGLSYGLGLLAMFARRVLMAGGPALWQTSTNPVQFMGPEELLIAAVRAILVLLPYIAFFFALSYLTIKLALKARVSSAVIAVLSALACGTIALTTFAFMALGMYVSVGDAGVLAGTLGAAFYGAKILAPQGASQGTATGRETPCVSGDE